VQHLDKFIQSGIGNTPALIVQSNRRPSDVGGMSTNLSSIPLEKQIPTAEMTVNTPALGQT
jgi:hypothetical protein